jgi:hypothetical protein
MPAWGTLWAVANSVIPLCGGILDVHLFGSIGLGLTLNSELKLARWCVIDFDDR